MQEVLPLARDFLSPETQGGWEDASEFVSGFYHNFLEQRLDLSDQTLVWLRVELAKLFLREKFLHHPPVLNELEGVLNQTYSGNTLPKINPPSLQAKRSILYIFQMYRAYQDKRTTEQERTAAKSRITNELGALQQSP